MRAGHEPEATASGPGVLACQASPRVASGRDGAQRQSRTSRPARQTTLASHDEDCYLRRAPSALRVGDVYCHGSFLRLTVRDAIGGRWRQNLRPQAWIFAGRELWKGWTVMDRLGEIKVPTLVMAGRDDVFSPPEHQGQLAAGIPRARLQIIERAGHFPYSERPAEAMAAAITVTARVIPGTTALTGPKGPGRASRKSPIWLAGASAGQLPAASSIGRFLRPSPTVPSLSAHCAPRGRPRRRPTAASAPEEPGECHRPRHQAVERSAHPFRGKARAATNVWLSEPEQPFQCAARGRQDRVVRPVLRSVPGRGPSALVRWWICPEA